VIDRIPAGRGLYNQAAFEVKQPQDQFKGHNKFHAYADDSRPIQAWALLEYDLPRLEDQVARKVVDANPRGYSTTFSDLLHDLVP
jgi:hypothetical protein